MYKRSQFVDKFWTNVWEIIENGWQIGGKWLANNWQMVGKYVIDKLLANKIIDKKVANGWQIIGNGLHMVENGWNMAQWVAYSWKKLEK